MKKVICLTAFVSAVTWAGPITFTETIVTSGTLDGTSFTNQLVTLTLSGDTGSITNPLPGVFALIGPASVTVATIGSDTFTDSINVADNQNNNSAGFGDVSSNHAIVFANNPAFGSYTLSASIGPLSGGSDGDSGSSYATSGGSLILNGPFDIDHPATFTASVSTPEPATLAMLGLGIGLISVGRRLLR